MHVYMSPGEPVSAAGFPALAQRVEAYLARELTARSLYGRLAGEVQNEVIRTWLEQAAGDEQKHYRLLCPVYRRLAGRPPRVEPREVTYSGVRDGLLMAIEDALKALEEYKDEFQRFQDQDPTLRHIFFELLSDEMRHAVRLSTALHLLSGP